MINKILEKLPFTKAQSKNAFETYVKPQHASIEAACKKLDYITLKTLTAFDDGKLEATQVRPAKRCGCSIISTVDFIHDGQLVQITLEISK